MANTKVRLELTLEELHTTIRDSVKTALAAHKTTIANVSTADVRILDGAELTLALAELGRNAAGALMMAFGVADELPDEVAS